MVSIDSYLTPLLLVLVIIIHIPNMAFFENSKSTCPNNKDTICSILPFNISNPPDVWLNVPTLSVDKISLVVENLKAHVSLSANVAHLVSLNAGVDVSVNKVNLTITGTIYIKKNFESSCSLFRR
jgi:hypothetical protein